MKQRSLQHYAFRFNVHSGEYIYIYILDIMLTLLFEATYNYSFTDSHTTAVALRATASWSGAVRVRRLTQGQLHTQLGRSGDRNLLVPSQPAPPPALPISPLV